MATVRQSGGDYTSLAAALSAGETVIDIDQAWTIDDSSLAVFSADCVITVSGPARHPGYCDFTQNHYRLVCTSGHCLTLNGNYSVTIDGICIEQAGTGSSNEAFRCVPGQSDTVTIKNSLLYCSTITSMQDVLYTGYNTSIGIISIENSELYGAGRGGVCIQNCNSVSGSSGTIKINSSSIFNNGRVLGTANSKGGGIFFSRNSSSYSYALMACAVHNTISIGNNTQDGSDYMINNGPGIGPDWDISYSIDGDGSIGAYSTGGTGNLANRAASDSDTPGAGAWVIFENITTSPYDLRLKDNAENDAQDAHNVASAHGLTIPALDITGLTARPQNTNYDIGAYEIPAGAPGESKQSTDSGAGAEATPLAAGIASTDTASGAEALAAAAGIVSTDTASAVDALAASPGIVSTDTASGAEALAAAAGIISTDAGATVELGNVPLASVVAAEVAGSSDIASAIQSQAIQVADGASSLDAPSLASAVLALTEAGAGIDALPLAALQAALDAGIGLDVSATTGSTQKSASDAGTSGEGLTISAIGATGIDFGAGAEALTLSAGITVIEIMNGVESGQLAGEVKQIADSGSFADVINPPDAVLELIDAGVSFPTATIAADIQIADAGAGIESGQIGGVLREIDDSGVGVDIAAASFAFINAIDSINGIDIAYLPVKYDLVQDSGIGIDLVSRQVTGEMIQVTNIDMRLLTVSEQQRLLQPQSNTQLNTYRRN